MEGSCMVTLDRDARSAVESNIDAILEDAKGMKEAYSILIRKQSIEPNLETVLSFLTGLVTGLVNGIYISKYRRQMTKEELEELYKLLKRRADCIKCSKCISACPLRLHPVSIFEAIEKGDVERAKRLYLTDCFRCGICSYVCPSGIPLAQTIARALKL